MIQPAFLRILGIGGLLITAIGCRSYPPIRTADYVDLERFAGRWYVIAHIPASIEEEAFNATETYEVQEGGTIATTFRFNEGDFDGPERVYEPRAFVTDDGSNAIWKMQFFWPFKADYRILYLSPDYREVVVGRLKRDYAWIMARTPRIDASTYDQLVAVLIAEGYDLADLRKVPQIP